jgi:hypothetical protein
MSVQYTDRIAGTNTVIAGLADPGSTSVNLCWLTQLPSQVRTVIFVNQNVARLDAGGRTSTSLDFHGAGLA